MKRTLSTALFLAGLFLFWQQPARAGDLAGQIGAALRDEPDMLVDALSTKEGMAAFEKLLSKALEARPELVLKVLEKHPDAVFATAQKGAAVQKRKAFYARWKNDAKNPKNISLENHILRGDANAPVTIAVFSDFTCAYCDMASKTLKGLQAKMPGAFNYAFKPHPAKNNPAAMQAAQWFVAASLRDPQKAWDFYETLFGGADRLLDDPDAFLPEAAREAGFDAEILASEAGSRRVADIIAADQEEAARLGVSGTPYLFVDDLVIPGAPDENLLREAVERATAPQ